MDDKKNYSTQQNLISEITFVSAADLKDPFNDIELNGIFTDPEGKKHIVPGFWAGDNTWRIRYSSSITGIHEFRTECSEDSDEGLHGQEGTIEISSYTGENRLFKHGPIKVSSDNKHLAHEDGTPFFWMADTWYHAFVGRFKWPEEFKLLSEDRKKKGFSVIYIVAGLLPDSGAFEATNTNEGGFPWTEDFKSINPAYFDAADIKLEWLIESGFVPSVFGAWGYYLSWMGVDKLKKHWRYIVARWGAYPVIWCVAGEADRSELYVSDETFKKENIQKQNIEWVKIGKYLRSIDPYQRLTTVHPMDAEGDYSSSDVFSDPDLFDIDILQTGHWNERSFDITLENIQKSLSTKPTKPVINAEVCYEGICGSCWQDTQRFLFWTHMLSGTAGHSYGADGIWNLKGKEKQGESEIWGGTPWKEAYKFKGSFQQGLAKKFLEKFDWYKFEPHPEWVYPHWSDSNRMLPYAAGIPKKVKFIYFPGICFLKDVYDLKIIKIKNIDKDIRWISYFFNPRTGEIVDKKDVKPSDNDQWIMKGRFLAPLPTMLDWVLVLEAE